MLNIQNVTSFKAISLNKDETKQASILLRSIDNPSKKDTIKLELFNIFDKHLQSEAKNKSSKLYKREDFLQRMYLIFLESLENIKPLTLDKLLKILNDIKPTLEEIKEEYRYGIISIDKSISDSDNRTLESLLSENKVQKPKSSISPEERKGQQKVIQEVSQILSPEEQDLIQQRSLGKAYTQIADEVLKSDEAIRRKIKSAIAKIQLNQNILPEKYKLFADNFVKTFNLNLNSQEAINYIIDHIELTTCSIDSLNNNINTTSKLLDLDRSLFINAALKTPQLFCLKPETIAENIDRTSNLLDINKKIFINTALKKPTLFYQKPETIAENIDRTSKLLEIDRRLSIKAALKQPQLFYQKPETIFANIDRTSKLLGIDKITLTNAALKKPTLFFIKSDTIDENIDRTSKLLEVDRKIFIKAALKQPTLFYQKPETIFANIDRTSKLLEIDKIPFTYAALKQASLFYQRPETIAKNIDRTSKLLDIDRKIFIKAALKQPQLFCQEPETIFANIDKMSKLLDINRKIFINTALKKPTLFYQKPETIAKKVNINKYYKQIQGKMLKKIVISFDSTKKLYYNILAFLIKKHDNLIKIPKEEAFIDYLKSKNKIYELKIPKNELAEEFIKYVQDFSNSNFCKQIFKIIIK